MFPIRCFSCGKVLGGLSTRVDKLKTEGKTNLEIFEILKIERYCCRRIIMSSIDISDIALQYKPLKSENNTS